MSLTRRRFLGGLASLSAGVGASVLAGCGATSTQAPVSEEKTPASGVTAAPQEAVKITYLRYELGPDEQKEDDHAQSLFKEWYPNITAERLSVPSQEFFDKIQTMIAAGNAPDTFWMDPNNVWMDWCKKGALRELGPYFEKDADFFKDWTPQVLDWHKFCEKPYGLTLGGACANYPLWINTNWFKEVGAKDPIAEKDNYTIDDFIANCKMLTDAENKKFGYDINGGQWDAWVDEFGGHVHDVQEPSKITLDTPEAREALQFLVDLRWTWNAMPQATQGTAETTGRMGYAAGKIAQCHRGPGTTWLEGADVFTNQWAAIAYPPKGKDGTWHINTTILMQLIYSQSKHPDETWLWMKTVASPEHWQWQAENQGGGPCPNPKLNEQVWYPIMDKLLAEKKGMVNYQVFADAMPYCRTWIKLPGEASSILSNGLDPLFLNQITVDEFIAETVPKVQENVTDWWKDVKC